MFYVLFTTIELVLRTLLKLEFCAERAIRLEVNQTSEKGTLLFTLGELYFYRNKEKKAFQMIQQAKDSFEKYFDSEHESITACIEILRHNN